MSDTITLTDHEMTYYTREIKAPANKADGLANFVQMIINRAEAGDVREALLLAVDLHQDLTSGVYREVTSPDLRDAGVPMTEHARAVEAAYKRGVSDGLKRGQDGVRSELKRLLGDAA